MSEKTINFGDKKINKKYFYDNKNQFNIEDIDINKILISKPKTYENNMRKYIGYNDNTISPLQFDSDPIYNNKYINTKIRSYNNDIKTNFRNIDNKNNKLPEKNKPYKCVSLISLDSIIKINKKYYSQILLQECVYKLMNKKVENIITNINLDSSSESDNELDYE